MKFIFVLSPVGPVITVSVGNVSGSQLTVSMYSLRGLIVTVPLISLVKSERFNLSSVIPD